MGWDTRNPTGVNQDGVVKLGGVVRSGTASQNSAYTGKEGELTYDIENKALFVHDGSTPGGTQVGGFTPTDLSGLEFWFDANDDSTITEVSGEVSQWDDKSGNGRDIVQLTAGQKPNTATLEGVSTLFFDGDDALNLGSLSVQGDPMTIFGVAASADIVGFKYIWSVDDTEQFIRQNSADFAAGHGVTAGSASALGIANAWSLLTPRAFVIRTRSDNPSEVELDDGTTDTDSTVGTLQQTITDLTVGARNSVGLTGWNGHIMEIGAYSQLLSDVSKTDLMNYLKIKWGL